MNAQRSAGQRAGSTQSTTPSYRITASRRATISAQSSPTQPTGFMQPITPRNCINAGRRATISAQPSPTPSTDSTLPTVKKYCVTAGPFATLSFQLPTTQPEGSSPPNPQGNRVATTPAASPTEPSYMEVLLEVSFKPLISIKSSPTEHVFTVAAADAPSTPKHSLPPLYLASKLPSLTDTLHPGLTILAPQTQRRYDEERKNPSMKKLRASLSWDDFLDTARQAYLETYEDSRRERKRKRYVDGRNR